MCLYTHVLNKGAHAACAVAAADSGACFFGYLLVMQQESTSLVGASPGFCPQSGQAA